MKGYTTLRAQLAIRAGNKCEYCLIREDDAFYPHEVDHVISRQHGGLDDESNLCFSCMLCNRYKGPNIASRDSSGRIVALFNPRTESWIDHFRISGTQIRPITAVGEATVRLLRLNDPERIAERTLLLQLGRIEP